MTTDKYELLLAIEREIKHLLEDYPILRQWSDASTFTAPPSETSENRLRMRQKQLENLKKPLEKHRQRRYWK